MRNLGISTRSLRKYLLNETLMKYNTDFQNCKNDYTDTVIIDGREKHNGGFSICNTTLNVIV